MGRIVVTGIQHKREKGNEKREKRSREFDFKRNVYGKGRRHGTDGLVCLAKKERGRLERLSVKVTGPKRRTKKKGEDGSIADNVVHNPGADLLVPSRYRDRWRARSRTTRHVLAIR